MKSKKVFGVFNVVDLLIILLVFATVIFGIRHFLVEKTLPQNQVKLYSYTVEGQQVLDETVDMPKIGGKAYNSSTSVYLGVVARVESEPFREVIFVPKSNTYEQFPVEGYSNIFLTISGSGVENDRNITIEGNIVKVGEELNVKGKGYAFKGIIVDVREGE